MTDWALDAPQWLWGLPLTLLPLWRLPLRPEPWPWLALLPVDAASRAVDLSLRLAGAGAILALLLGSAGLHRREYTVERTGYGAHMVLLLDRSRSMDDSFAGRTSGGGEESKSAAAERLLSGFVSGGRNDRVGVAAFSTSPLFVLPLTDNRQAVLAAVHAMKLPGLAQTHVSKGLAMALSYFGDEPPAGSRIILLVSDGAAEVDPDSELKLRRWFKEKGVRLYWIFLRTAGSHGIFEAPDNPEDDNAQARPERYLHLFFTSLGIPYRAYEAEDADALKRAIADIDREEQRPLRYAERVPRRDLQAYCYLAAALALAWLVAAKGMEVAR
ncbi:vWA domain-containing protein [Methylococcus geothermalis]|uniref:VWA domain-containing protein n=1 Tax=Methylococcus geothermalis TaxID=2681310 RepID=A0A858Q5Z4_9GAMM|nr:vWA domain-containing protein [Methylococcus geothermalis]QJD29282.1 VWA domain-containing protein [Methylococcus geothermalis]